MSDTTFEKHLEVIHEKLDRLDVAIRGNGRPGITVQLDPLEQDAKRQGRLIWLLLGALFTGLASALAVWIAG